MPLSCAVVPYTGTSGADIPLTPEDLPHLRQGNDGPGEIEILLHGYAHRKDALVAGGRPSEFASLSKEAQTEKIREGKAVLSRVFNREILGFVPPFNTYDGQTLHSLKANGFSLLSAGTVDANGQESRDVRLVPKTVDLRNLGAAVRVAEQFRRFEPVIIVVFHHYDFAESQRPPPAGCAPSFSLEDYSRTLSLLRQSPEWRFSTLKGVAQKVSATVGSAVPYFRHRRAFRPVIRQHIPHQFLPLKQSKSALIQIATRSILRVGARSVGVS